VGKTINCFWDCNLTKKIKIQYGFLKFLFVFLWFLGYQTEKIGIAKCIITLSHQTSKDTSKALLAKSIVIHVRNKKNDK
jgi:hypothetical protein